MIFYSTNYLIYECGLITIMLRTQIFKYKVSIEHTMTFKTIILSDTKLKSSSPTAHNINRSRIQVKHAIDIDNKSQNVKFIYTHTTT
jgi:hypothetical protein